MNFVKKIYAKNILTVLDCGALSTIALVAEKKSNGLFYVIGAGDAVTQGVRNGEIIHSGDAAESVVEALGKAERSSGIKVEKLYYNFDDLEMQSVFSRGSRFLNGEGEIHVSDIVSAQKVAERLAGDFEKNIVYARPIKFIIDDRDEVINPVGVFGKKLDVLVHILQSRSSHSDAWHRLMQRAQIFRSTPILSAWSTAYGLLPKNDRMARRLIMDLGQDLLNAFVFADGQINQYKVKSGCGKDALLFGDQVRALIHEFLSLDPCISEILLTGDCAQDQAVLNQLEGRVPIAFRAALPYGISKLLDPRAASVAGLLLVADEIESRMPMLRADRGIFSSAKQKALSLMEEYF